MTSANQLQNMNYLPKDEALALLTREGPAILANEVNIGRRVKFQEDNGIPVLQLNNDTEVHLTAPDTAERLLKFLDIPRGFAKDTPVNLLNPIMEERIQRHRSLVVVTDEEGQLVELKNQGDLQPLVDPTNLLTQIEEQFPEVLYQRAEVDAQGNANLLAITQSGETRLEELLAPGVHHFLPDGGDPFRSGIHLRFSTTGLTAPAIQPYMVRLWCLNGALHGEFLDQWSRGYGEGDEIYQYFRQGMEEAAQRTRGIMGRYAGMVQEIDGGGQGRRAAVEGLIHAARLPAGQANDVRDRAIVDPPVTHLDVWNLLTANASHNSRNFGEQLTRMARAGHHADPEQVHTWCATCGRN